MGYLLSTQPQEPITYYTYCKVKKEMYADGSYDIMIYYGSQSHITGTAVLRAPSNYYRTLSKAKKHKYYDITVKGTEITRCTEVHPEINSVVRGITPTANYSLNRVYLSSGDYLLVPSSIKVVKGSSYGFMFEYDEDDNKVAKRILDGRGCEIYTDQ